MSEFKYDFFISYKHSELDAMLAVRLQKMLEQYRIPKEVRERYGRQAIGRVFRDNAELSVTPDLQAEIEAQLAQSEYLIVICSPRARMAEWVAWEIETFLKYRGREYILPVLLEGEPEESFPSCLSVQQPRAADMRGKNAHEIRKKCSGDELLRLVAASVGCTFDELKQRHRVYRMRRLTVVLSAVLVVSLGFGAWSLYQSMQIRNNYRLVQENQSRLLAGKSQQLLEAGDREAALLVALEALPDEKDDRPLVGEAQIVLENALYLTAEKTGQDFYALDKYQMEEYPQALYAQNEEKTLLATVDTANTIYIWDLEASKRAGTCRLEEVTQSSFDIVGLSLSGQDTMFLWGSEGVVCIDWREGKLLWSWQAAESDSYYMSVVAYNPATDTLACVRETSEYFDWESKKQRIELTVTLLDGTSGTVRKEYSHSFVCGTQEYPEVRMAVWNREGTRLAVLEQSGESWFEGECVYLLDTETGKICILDASSGSGMLGEMVFQDEDTLIFLGGMTFSLSMGAVYDRSPYTVAAYDCVTGEELWKVENEAVMRDGYPALSVSSLERENGAGIPVVTASVYSEVLNISDGKVLSEFSYGQTVAGVSELYGTTQMHLTDDGEIHTVNIEEGYMLEEDYGQMKLGLEEVPLALWLPHGNLLAFASYDNAVYRYGPYEDEAGTMLEDGEGLLEGQIDVSGRLFLGRLIRDDSYGVRLWDVQTGELLWKADEERIESFGFGGTDSCYYVSEQNLVLYSIEERTVSETYLLWKEDAYVWDEEVASVMQEDGTPAFYYRDKKGQEWGGEMVIKKLSGNPLHAETVITEQMLQELFWNEVPETEYVNAFYDSSYLPSPDGRYLALWSKLSETGQTGFAVWDTKEQRLLKLPEIRTGISEAYRKCVCVFSQDSRSLLVYGEDQAVHLFDLEQEKETESIPYEGDSYRMFFFSPDGRYIFLHTYEYDLQIYDTETNQWLMNERTQSRPIAGYDFSDEGRELRLMFQSNWTTPGIHTYRRQKDGSYECFRAINAGCYAANDRVRLICHGDELYVFPIYTLDQLRDMAKEILDGRTLTEAERKKYMVPEEA